ncbi:MAG: hypothetical protein GXX79_12970 [Actinomycetales bacterium]|nr:hypothetical protein [Actinomycetales bacterium]
MLGRGLAAMRTRGWTGDEPRAVAAFLRNVWTTRISAETGHPDPVEVLIALAGVAEDVRPQAGQWQERTGDPVVAEHFRRLVAHARDTADRDEEFRAEGWWDGDVDPVVRVLIGLGVPDLVSAAPVHGRPGGEAG